MQSNAENANKRRCKICKTEYENHQDLLIHETDHLYISLDKIKPDSCPICKTIFTSRAALLSHINNKCTHEINFGWIDGGRIKTAVFDKSDEKINKIIKSNRFFHSFDFDESIEAFYQDNGLVKCKYCYKEFEDLEDLWNHSVCNHVEKHPNLDNFICPVCNRLFLRKYDLVHHFIKSHLICSFCYKKFNDILKYFTHVCQCTSKGRAPVTSVPCFFCKEKFADKITFSNHFLNCSNIQDGTKPVAKCKLGLKCICHQSHYLPHEFDNHILIHVKNKSCPSLRNHKNVTIKLSSEDFNFDTPGIDMEQLSTELHRLSTAECKDHINGNISGSVDDLSNESFHSCISLDKSISHNDTSCLDVMQQNYEKKIILKLENGIWSKSKSLLNDVSSSSAIEYNDISLLPDVSYVNLTDDNRLKLQCKNLPPGLTNSKIEKVDDTGFNSLTNSLNDVSSSSTIEYDDINLLSDMSNINVIEDINLLSDVSNVNIAEEKRLQLKRKNQSPDLTNSKMAKVDDIVLNSVTNVIRQSNGIRSDTSIEINDENVSPNIHIFNSRPYVDDYRTEILPSTDTTIVDISRFDNLLENNCDKTNISHIQSVVNQNVNNTHLSSEILNTCDKNISNKNTLSYRRDMVMLDLCLNIEPDDMLPKTDTITNLSNVDNSNIYDASNGIKTVPNFDISAFLGSRMKSGFS